MISGFIANNSRLIGRIFFTEEEKDILDMFENI